MLEGDVAGGSVDQAENLGGVRLEYRAALDRRGAEAELTQAQIDRSIALRNILALRDDVRYAVAGLTAEIEIAGRALERQQAHLASERAKLDEANARYRRGRADTTQIIDFERDLRSAELLVDQQTIELARRRTELAIRTGGLWEHVTPGAEKQRAQP
jgi:outer membrane protein TolC